MRANAIEAAEQCGILNLPDGGEPVAFCQSATADDGRLLVFCDEDAPIADPVAALTDCARRRLPLAVLIGPEGGFAEEERAALLKRTSFASRSARASCAPIPRRSPRSRWFRPCSGIGGLPADRVMGRGSGLFLARRRSAWGQ